MKSENQPLIIAHRGASAAAPENTVAAFKRAMDFGADGIELDVRLAKDGVPVIIHDATLKRTGLRDGSVARMTSTELTNIDVGTWFNRVHPALAQNEFSRERISRLTTVFDLFANGGSYKERLVYVEIKTKSDDASRDDLISSVAELIIQRKITKRVVVISFDLDVIANIKRFDASIRTGALFAPKQALALKRSRNILTAAIDKDADEILLHKLLARPRLVDCANERGLPVVVWTVNHRNWIRRHEKLNIHALITNDPQLFVTRS